MGPGTPERRSFMFVTTNTPGKHCARRGRRGHPCLSQGSAVSHCNCETEADQARVPGRPVGRIGWPGSPGSAAGLCKAHAGVSTGCTEPASPASSSLEEGSEGPGIGRDGPCCSTAEAPGEHGRSWDFYGGQQLGETKSAAQLGVMVHGFVYSGSTERDDELAE